MSLLFDAPLIDGLRYEDGVISEADERALLGRLEALDLAPFRFHGWLGNRRTQELRLALRFRRCELHAGEPIPEWLHAGAESGRGLRALEPSALVHVLLARYDPGAGIGWHRDRDVFDEVVGISLGTPATLRFRRRTDAGFKRASLHLEPRSAYLLSGAARHDWEHSIAPGEQLRFSVTFRALSAKGERIADKQG